MTTANPFRSTSHIVCPKCSYKRQQEEDAPAYECPSCGIVYAKYRAPGDALDEAAVRRSAIREQNVEKSVLPYKILIFVLGTIAWSFIFVLFVVPVLRHVAGPGAIRLWIGAGIGPILLLAGALGLKE
jgi:ribosomal protein L37AE/L43A